MDIEKRLKDDAARFSGLQPPADLRVRLQTSLDAVPPVILPKIVRRPVGKWFAPAVAMLTAVMVLVFVSALPPEIGVLSGRKTEVFSGDQSGIQSAEFRSEGTEEITMATETFDCRLNNVTDSGKDLPLARMGLIAGLALVTGFLCVLQLKGHPRLLAVALIALIVLAAGGLSYIYSVW